MSDELQVKRPQPQGGDYRPHYRKDAADAYMAAAEARNRELEQECEEDSVRQLAMQEEMQQLREQLVDLGAFEGCQGCGHSILSHDDEGLGCGCPTSNGSPCGCEEFRPNAVQLAEIVVGLREQLAAAREATCIVLQDRAELREECDRYMGKYDHQSELVFELREQLAQQFNAAKQFSEAVVRLTEQRDKLLIALGKVRRINCPDCHSPEIADAAIKAAVLPATQKTVDRVQKFWDAQAEWSQATFGSDEVRGPIGPLKHLEKEAQECQQDPYNIEEKADCLSLIFDATRRSRKSLNDLLDAAEAKLAKNKLRSWPKNAPGDTAIEHVRRAALPATQEEGEK